MLVFIDESGDAGLDVAGGASPIFVAAMVVFTHDAAAAATQRAIDNRDARRLPRREFKFSKCRDEVRDRFFDTVRGCDFNVRAIVVRKARTRSPAQSAGQDRFYEFFVESLMRRSEDALADAKVIIDGSGSKSFRQSVDAVLRRRLRSGAVRSVRFKDSRDDVLLQLADMCAGAIARAYKTERAQADRWLNKLQPRIADVWEFP